MCHKTHPLFFPVILNKVKNLNTKLALIRSFTIVQDDTVMENLYDNTHTSFFSYLCIHYDRKQTHPTHQQAVSE